MKNIIIKELKKIEEIENVRIIMAVESGSRAWGFASEESDYDVRFIYVRKPKDYLKLNEIRDVIEWKLDDTLDINGWDIKKVLQLLHKSNPTVFEWFSSSIIYLATDEYYVLKNYLDEYFSMKKSIFHYLNMAKSNYKTYINQDNVRIKKYFYVLRPLLAAKWIVDLKSVPPILFDKLVEKELDESLKSEVEKLLVMKKSGKEMGLAPTITNLNEYIEKEMIEIEEFAKKVDETNRKWDLLDDVFYKIVMKK